MTEKVPYSFRDGVWPGTETRHTGDRGPCTKCGEPTARKDDHGRWHHGWCEGGLAPARYAGLLSRRRATTVESGR